jgi:hypothetical protein
VSTTEKDNIVEGSLHSNVSLQALCILDWLVISLCLIYDAKGVFTPLD